MKLLRLIVLTGCIASASQAIDTDKVAHFGVGYICQDLGGKLSQRMLRLEKLDAQIFAGVGCMFVGLVKEATDHGPDAGDLAAQFAGQLISITFDF